MAVFPPAAQAGGIRLNHPTLYHATAIEALGVSFGGGINPGNIYLIAWFLSMTGKEVAEKMANHDRIAKGFEAWAKEHSNVSISALVESANSLINGAMALYIPAASKKQKPVANAVPQGLGWTLELGEALAHEYGMPFSEAMSLPLATAFAMMACATKRNGGELGGPDYYERISIGKIKDSVAKAKAAAKKAKQEEEAK